MKSGSNTIVMQGLFVAGERDGLVLGTMKNVRIRASVEETAKSLALRLNEGFRHLCAQRLRLLVALVQ